MEGVVAGDIANWRPNGFDITGRKQESYQKLMAIPEVRSAYTDFLKISESNEHKQALAKTIFTFALEHSKKAAIYDLYELLMKETFAQWGLKVKGTTAAEAEKIAFFYKIILQFQLMRRDSPVTDTSRFNTFIAGYFPDKTPEQVQAFTDKLTKAADEVKTLTEVWNECIRKIAELRVVSAEALSSLSEIMQPFQQAIIHFFSALKFQSVGADDEAIVYTYMATWHVDNPGLIAGQLEKIQANLTGDALLGPKSYLLTNLLSRFKNAPVSILSEVRAARFADLEANIVSIFHEMGTDRGPHELDASFLNESQPTSEIIGDLLPDYKAHIESLPSSAEQIESYSKLFNHEALLETMGAQAFYEYLLSIRVYAENFQAAQECLNQFCRKHNLEPNHQSEKFLEKVARYYSVTIPSDESSEAEWARLSFIQSVAEKMGRAVGFYNNFIKVHVKPENYHKKMEALEQLAAKYHLEKRKHQSAESLEAAYLYYLHTNPSDGSSQAEWARLSVLRSIAEQIGQAEDFYNYLIKVHVKPENFHKKMEALDQLSDKYHLEKKHRLPVFLRREWERYVSEFRPGDDADTELARLTILQSIAEDTEQASAFYQYLKGADVHPANSFNKLTLLSEFLSKHPIPEGKGLYQELIALRVKPEHFLGKLEILNRLADTYHFSKERQAEELWQKLSRKDWQDVLSRYTTNGPFETLNSLLYRLTSFYSITGQLALPLLKRIDAICAIQAPAQIKDPKVRSTLQAVQRHLIRAIIEDSEDLHPQLKAHFDKTLQAKLADPNSNLSRLMFPVKKDRYYWLGFGLGEFLLLGAVAAVFVFFPPAGVSLVAAYAGAGFAAAMLGGWLGAKLTSKLDHFIYNKRLVREDAEIADSFKRVKIVPSKISDKEKALRMSDREQRIYAGVFVGTLVAIVAAVVVASVFCPPLIFALPLAGKIAAMTGMAALGTVSPLVLPKVFARAAVWLFGDKEQKAPVQAGPPVVLVDEEKQAAAPRQAAVTGQSAVPSRAASLAGRFRASFMQPLLGRSAAENTSFGGDGTPAGLSPARGGAVIGGTGLLPASQMNTYVPPNVADVATTTPVAGVVTPVRQAIDVSGTSTTPGGTVVGEDGRRLSSIPYQTRHGHGSAGADVRDCDL